jgi:6-phosphogluconolactonase
VYSYGDEEGTLQALQTSSTLPDDFTGMNIVADIHIAPSGKYLYVSNRGHNSIAIFAIDPATGYLTTVDFVLTQGNTPRNFTFDPTGSWLLVANQDSDNLVQFKVDQATGQLEPIGQITGIPRPAFVTIVDFDRP